MTVVMLAAGAALAGPAEPEPVMDTLRQVTDRTSAKPAVQGGAYELYKDGTSKVRHVVKSWTKELRFVFASEMPEQLSYPVRASIAIGAATYPVTFNGAATGTVPLGGQLISDVIMPGRVFKPGDVIYSQTWTSYTGPNIPHWHNAFWLSRADGEWTALGDRSQPGGTGEDVIADAMRLRGPSRILGLAPADQLSVAFSGDSILQGGKNSWAVTWMDRLGIPWTSYARWAENVGVMKGIRQYRFSGGLGNYSHVLVQLGTNDMAGVPGSQADYLEYWTWLRAQGPKVIQCTLLPHTQPMPSVVPVASQVPEASKEPKKSQFNAWIRDGAPISNATTPAAVGSTGTIRAGQTGHPLARTFDLASYAESSLGSGKWRVDKGVIAPDGLHPHEAGSKIIADALPNAFPA